MCTCSQSWACIVRTWPWPLTDRGVGYHRLEPLCTQAVMLSMTHHNTQMLTTAEDPAVHAVLGHHNLRHTTRTHCQCTVCRASRRDLGVSVQARQEVRRECRLQFLLPDESHQSSIVCTCHACDRLPSQDRSHIVCWYDSGREVLSVTRLEAIFVFQLSSMRSLVFSICSTCGSATCCCRALCGVK